MRISPINVNYQQKSLPVRHRLKETESASIPQQTEVNFKGKHDFAKTLGAVFGGAGTVGAITGTLIMTGGLAAATLPFIAAYGALSGAGGVILGHQIDKDSEENDTKNTGK